MGDVEHTDRLYLRREWLVLAGSVVLAACTGGDGESEAEERAEEALDAIEERGATVDTRPPATPAPAPAEVATLTAIAQHERELVALHDAVLAAVEGERIGGVPPVVVELARSARKHHAAHADAVDDLLTAVGAPVAPAPGVPADRAAELAAATDAGAVQALLLTAHVDAARGHLDALDALDDLGSRQLVTTIRPVELQLAAVLRFFGGDVPVPSALG